MKLTEEVYLVGSGKFGFELSNDFDCHVFLLDGGGEAALIDAGVGLEVEQILNNIRATGMPTKRITKVILTHAHADHMGGASQLRAAFGAEVYAPWEAAPWIRAGDEKAVSLELARRAGYYPEDYRLQGCEVDVQVRDGARIRIGDLELVAIETPGHSRGHCSYFVQGRKRNLLFAGDHVFYGGAIIVQNIPDCSIQEYAASVFKLEGLGVNALLCGHMTLPLRNGQKHIDQAIAAFRGLMVPKNLL
jgi:glyoxylase-like metal-dependent hydrolase (beta-lactamase superfamily II)